MHLNTTPDDPPRLPCMRDLHVVLTEPLLMLSPLEELAHRLHEVAA
jgi:hypothetical protein